MRHLAAVERWLQPQRSSSSSNLRQYEPEELAAELGLNSLAGSEDLEDFVEHFATAVGTGELLVATIPCLLQSKTFRHPGTFYISSERLCFRSSVLGMEARLVISWSMVEWARLITGETNSMHPVRIRLKQSAEVDGNMVDSFDIRIFDVGALAHLHSCATYFIGTGLFDIVPSDDRRVSMPSPSPLGGSGSGIGETLAAGPRARAPTMTAEAMVADLEQLSLVWELQRRTTIWHSDWRAPFLPHDYQKAIKWMSIQDHYLPHPFIPEDIDIDDAAESEEPPIEEVQFLGRRRACKWDVVVDETSDSEGWQLGSRVMAFCPFYGSLFPSTLARNSQGAPMRHLGSTLWTSTWSPASGAVASAASRTSAAGGGSRPFWGKCRCCRPKSAGLWPCHVTGTG